MVPGSVSEDRKGWLQDTTRFLTKKVGGEDNILAAHLHDDESTPHLHFIAVPLIQKERRRVGRKPKRPASKPAPEPVVSWALAAADLVGDRKKLTALQTDYADAVAGWGLHRGRPRALTNARHKSPAQYRAEVAQHAAREKTSLERATVEQMRELSDAMAEGFRAVDDGRLRYQPPRDGAPATIAPGACAPSGTAWDRLTARIRPGLVPVLQYAKATARLVIREQEVAQREEEVITDAGKLLDMAGRVALLEHLPSSSRAEARVAQKIAQLFRGRER